MVYGLHERLDFWQWSWKSALGRIYWPTGLLPDPQWLIICFIQPGSMVFISGSTQFVTVGLYLLLL